MGESIREGKLKLRLHFISTITDLLDKVIQMNLTPELAHTVQIWPLYGCVKSSWATLQFPSNLIYVPEAVPLAA